MTERRLNEERKLYIDLFFEREAPKAGDCLMSIRKDGKVGTRYLVLSAYRVKRKNPNARPRIMMTVCDLIEHTPNQRVFDFHWYSRKKKSPYDFEHHLKQGIAKRQ
jgi:hypothetical protein